MFFILFSIANLLSQVLLLISLIRIMISLRPKKLDDEPEYVPTEQEISEINTFMNNFLTYNEDQMKGKIYDTKKI